MKHIKLLTVLACLLTCVACAAPIKPKAQLGLSDYRRVIIVGENVRPEIAFYYEKKYNGLVWFTPYEGKVSNAAGNFLATGIGLTHAMRGLISELQSMNYSIGRWEIIVPKPAENYFLKALKNMKTGSLSKARGMVILIDSKGFPDMETHVNRVTGGNFFVTYEFQEDLNP